MKCRCCAHTIIPSNSSENIARQTQSGRIKFSVKRHNVFSDSTTTVLHIQSPMKILIYIHTHTQYTPLNDACAAHVSTEYKHMHNAHKHVINIERCRFCPESNLNGIAANKRQKRIFRVCLRAFVCVCVMNACARVFVL